MYSLESEVSDAFFAADGTACTDTSTKPALLVRTIRYPGQPVADMECYTTTGEFLDDGSLNFEMLFELRDSILYHHRISELPVAERALKRVREHGVREILVSYREFPAVKENALN